MRKRVVKIPSTEMRRYRVVKTHGWGKNNWAYSMCWEVYKDGKKIELCPTLTKAKSFIRVDILKDKPRLLIGNENKLM